MKNKQSKADRTPFWERLMNFIDRHLEAGGLILIGLAALAFVTAPFTVPAYV